MTAGVHGGDAKGTVTGILRGAVGDLVKAAGERATESLGQKAGAMTERLTEYAKGTGNPSLVGAATGAKKVAEGGSPGSAMFSGGLAGLKEKVKGLFGKGGKGANKNFNRKVTNIVETIDVGVPVRVAYNQWTQFEDFPSFTKKVETVKRESDEKTTWKARVFWSHRSWEASIVQQVPDDCIVWRSKGQKGRVDGAVTFHELAPNLTRILLVLEYHPQGLFEQTGNLWRAQGRRARLEFKHFRRHVMTRTILNPDDVEGWRGEIRDGEVVKDHETALQEEQERETGREEEPDQEEEREPDEEEEEQEPEEEEEEEEQEPDEDSGKPGSDIDAEADRDETPPPKRKTPARRQSTRRSSRREREDA